MTMVRVQISIHTKGDGDTKAWWARYNGLREVGVGSDRRVVADGEPSWLPRVRDGEAWIDLPAGTVIRAGATHAGGLRCAKVTAPALIVAEGGEWMDTARDGTRQAWVTVTGARMATLEDLTASSDHELNPLAAYSDEELIKALERRGYVVIRAAAETGAR